MRTNRSESTKTNPRSELNGIQDFQHSGSKNYSSNGAHVSNVENSDTENEDDHPFRASDLRELSNPARLLYTHFSSSPVRAYFEFESDEVVSKTDAVFRNKILQLLSTTLTSRI